MKEELLEIVELSDGSIAIKCADSEEAPLLKIQFSNESLNLMGEFKLAVATAMINAGMHVLQEIHTLADESAEPVLLH